MEQRHVGRSGLRVSVVGLGTLTWGRDTDEHEATEQLREFVQAGGTLLDTAPAFGGGASETLVGSLLGSVVAREDVVIATRAALPGPDGLDVSRRGMLAALDVSLRRLGTDHVDLWSLPAWGDRVPLEESLSALEVAVSSGRARYAGIADLSGWQTARAASLTSLVATHSEYSLVQRGIEREVLPAARELGLGVLAWSPLGRGVLTGKYRRGTPLDSRGATPHLSGFVAPYLEAGPRAVVDAVVTAADGLRCAPLEVALAWLRDRPGVAGIVVGARNAAQLRALLKGGDVVLPPEIVAALDDISAPAVSYPERR